MRTLVKDGISTLVGLAQSAGGGEVPFPALVFKLHPINFLWMEWGGECSSLERGGKRTTERRKK